MMVSRFDYCRSLLYFCLIAAPASSPDIIHADDAAATADAPPAVMTTRDQVKVLPVKSASDAFHFVVYGDRTGGVPEGLKILEQAVADTCLLDPDLVMTVGDLIQGYNEKDEWMRQMREYQQIMNRLPMPWYPVAGNHDIYWRGEGLAPAGHHESNYEKHFGPLWYSFRHKNAGFIVLYSDEGDPVTNRKAFNRGDLQRMSATQLAFLDKALLELKDVDHIFAFLHHPRWTGGGYTGGNWNIVHEKLKSAGNVSAVFAGHIHHMRYDGPKDGIEYFTLATTGGHLSAEFPQAGYLHHLNLVTVRKERVSVTALPVGAVMDPRNFTPEFLAEVQEATTVRPRLSGPELTIHQDGTATGNLTYEIRNPCQHAIEGMVHVELRDSHWICQPDHQHVSVNAGQSVQVSLQLSRTAGHIEALKIPQLRMDLEYLSESTRIRLPEIVSPVDLRPTGSVPTTDDAPNRCLVVSGPETVVRVNASEIPLPNGPMTLEAWVNPNTLDGYNGIIAKTQGSEYALFSDEGVPQFDIHLNGNYVTASASKKLPVDRWTHVAGVFDGSQVTIFVNGKQMGATPGQGDRRTNDLPLFVGADPDGRARPTRPMAARIDEVRLSSTAMYQSNFTPARHLKSNEHTRMLLHFDRTLGPFVLDDSPGAVKATLGTKARLQTVVSP